MSHTHTSAQLLGLIKLSSHRRSMRNVNEHIAAVLMQLIHVLAAAAITADPRTRGRRKPARACDTLRTALAPSRCSRLLI